MSGEETDGSPKEMLITALVNVNEAVMESLEVTVICSAAAAYWADVGALPLPSPTSLAPGRGRWGRGEGELPHLPNKLLRHYI